MEYAILGNAAFFAVAFAMQIGCMSWDMLGFGQNDDDIAVKNLIQNQIPKTRKTPITPHLIMHLSRLEHREMIPLAHHQYGVRCAVWPDRKRQFVEQLF